MTVTMQLTLELAQALQENASAPAPDAATLQRTLRELLGRMEPSPLPLPKQKPFVRVAGLHAGQIQIADDFDAPLPETFWLGDE